MNAIKLNAGKLNNAIDYVVNLSNGGLGLAGGNGNFNNDRNTYIESLIEEIAMGKKEAVGELYNVISTDVYAYALAKTKNKHDAEDITSDTFVQIYKYARRYEKRGKPLAWIFTITSNLVNRYFTLKSRNVSFEENVVSLENGLQLESNEEKTLDGLYLRKMLSLLSNEEREIVILHLISQLKHREIAKLLGLPLSTVLSKYNRAIKKLSKMKERV